MCMTKSTDRTVGICKLLTGNSAGSSTVSLESRSSILIHTIRTNISRDYDYCETHVTVTVNLRDILKIQKRKVLLLIQTRKKHS